MGAIQSLRGYIEDGLLPVLHPLAISTYLFEPVAPLTKIPTLHFFPTPPSQQKSRTTDNLLPTMALQFGNQGYYSSINQNAINVSSLIDKFSQAR